jgi:hypothetical protein
MANLRLTHKDMIDEFFFLGIISIFGLMGSNVLCCFERINCILMYMAPKIQGKKKKKVKDKHAKEKQYTIETLSKDF